MGDGESAEGSVWEAMSFSSHYGLDNLVAIFDINRLGQSEPTALQHKMDVYKARCEAFGCAIYSPFCRVVWSWAFVLAEVVMRDIRMGCSLELPLTLELLAFAKLKAFVCSFHTLVVDGHCVKSIQAAFAEARSTHGKPTAILLKSFKGRGIPGIEDMDNWHGKPLGDKADAAIKGR